MDIFEHFLDMENLTAAVSSGYVGLSLHVTSMILVSHLFITVLFKILILSLLCS